MKTKENNSNMKIKDYFKFGEFLVCINKLENIPNMIGLCKFGVLIEVIKIYSKLFCSVSAYCDNTKGPCLHIALFPVKAHYTCCQVVNLVIWMLDDMGYIKHVKK